MEKEGSKMKVIMNIGLKLTGKEFDQSAYFKAIISEVAKLLKEII